MIRLWWLRHLWWKVRFFWDYKVLKKPMPKPVEMVKALLPVVAIVSILPEIQKLSEEIMKLDEKVSK